MRPRLIAETSLPALRWITPLTAGGWLVTQPAARTVTVLGPEMSTVATLGLTTDERDARVSVDDRHVAVASGRELTVSDRHGAVLWQRPDAGGPGAAPHLDRDGVLWVHFPPGDELAAFEAGTGREIDRIALESTVGGAFFVGDAGSGRLGLHVAMGQDGSLSWLVRLASGRITLRALGGECVTGFLAPGDRYFAMPHVDDVLAVRSVDTDEVLAERSLADILGPDGDADALLSEAAAVVSAELVIIAVGSDDDEDEEHLLLSTRSLRRHSPVEYPYPMNQNSIYPAAAEGRWLTSDYETGDLRLWELDDTPPPGQDALF